MERTASVRIASKAALPGALIRFAAIQRGQTTPTEGRQFTGSPSPPTRAPAGGSMSDLPRNAGGYRAQDDTRIA
jgi:hypothetical protein